MELSGPGFAPEDVLIHPQHHAAQTTLVELIEQLRACEGPADGFAFQKVLLERVLYAQSRRAEYSRAAKLMRKRGRPQPDAPEIESGKDPTQPGSWAFERDIWERISRQYRSVGDAMAWRAFGFERRYILSLSRNDAPGDMAGKAGLDAELAFVNAAWREGRFAILHDVTNCLRIGDVTVFPQDAPPRTEEIKTNPRRRNRAQLDRIRTAHEALWNAGTLPGDDPRQKLYDLAMPLKTHLELLQQTANRAAVDGVAATAVPGSRALLVMDQYGCLNAGITEENVAAAVDGTYLPALRAAGIGDRPQHRIAALSYDSAGRNALRAPWAIYPLHPIICARLIGDISVFMVESCGPDLAQLMQAAGLNARWALPAAHGSVMQPGELVMEFTETVSTPVGAGVLEQKRTLQMRQSDLDRYLIELLDPMTWTVAVRSMFEDPRLSGQPWPYYRDEDRVWV